VTLAAFALALALLLLTPGPTNTLLAVAGASQGFRRSLPLMGAEIAGYLTTIVPLVTFAGPFLETPLADRQCGQVSPRSAFVLHLAIRLWTAPVPDAAQTCIEGRCVYVTTVTNPKALIIGLALIPAGSFAETLPYLAVLSLTILVVASIWLLIGAAVIRAVSRRHPALVGRVAAGFLLFFAVSLAGKAAGLV